jgi:hypothetical protein
MKKIITLLIILLTAAAFPAQRFTDNGDGSIKDNATGLIWQKCSKGQSGNDCSGYSQNIHWDEALIHCEGLTLAGRDDWRLPSINELKSIINYKRSGPAINMEYFPNTPAYSYWTSSTFLSSPYTAWSVNFGTGDTYYEPTSSYSHIRCVCGP